MDGLTDKQALIDSIRSSEGIAFECDEAAILKEYENRKENTSSLGIKILSISGGFLATITFLASLGIFGLYDSPIGLLLFGFAFIVLAIMLNKEYDKLIIDTFSISTYISGLALLVMGLAEFDVDQNIIILLVSLIAGLTLFITQNYILSFIAVLAISGSSLMLIISNEFYDLIHIWVAIYTILLTYLFLNEAKIITTSKKLSKLYNPMRIGVMISLIVGLIFIGKRNLIPIAQNHLWISSVAMNIVLTYLVYRIINITGITALKNKILIFTLSGLILFSTLFMPSIPGALIILLLSFLVNYKTGLAIGVITLLYFISQYYYDLNLTLLTKSIILFSSGILFLLFYLYTNKMIEPHEEI